MEYRQINPSAYSVNQKKKRNYTCYTRTIFWEMCGPSNQAIISHWEKAIWKFQFQFLFKTFERDTTVERNLLIKRRTLYIERIIICYFCLVTSIIFSHEYLADYSAVKISDFSLNESENKILLEKKKGRPCTVDQITHVADDSQVYVSSRYALPSLRHDEGKKTTRYLGIRCYRLLLT